MAAQNSRPKIERPKIEFEASVNQVRTLADGGLRLVLDLPEDAVRQAAMLMQCKADGIALDIRATAALPNKRRGNGGSS